MGRGAVLLLLLLLLLLLVVVVEWLVAVRGMPAVLEVAIVVMGTRELGVKSRSDWNRNPYQ